LESAPSVLLKAGMLAPYIENDIVGPCVGRSSAHVSPWRAGAHHERAGSL
jgi:hypothetical protein